MAINDINTETVGFSAFYSYSLHLLFGFWFLSRYRFHQQGIWYVVLK